MVTLTANPRTARRPAPLTRARKTQATGATLSTRPGFWLVLLRALAAAMA